MALCLAVAYLLLCYVKTWGDLGSAVFGGRVIDSTLSHPIWGTRLGARLAGFAGAMLLVHLLLGLTSWVLAHASRRVWPDTSASQRTWSVCWLVMLAAWVLLANAAWFPRSSLGGPYHELVRVGIFGIDVFFVVTFGLGALLAYIVGTLLWRHLRMAHGVTRRSVWLATLVLVGVGAPLSGAIKVPAAQTHFDQPHVIVVGIDSLRTDYVQRSPTLTPAIDSFMSEAVVFTDTVTPLARTFPAWVSIVSGRHPHSTGAVINLFPRDLIDEGQTLPSVAREAGYQAVYAIDEVRFSNLDTSYGFDQMIGPPIGSADFLLGYIHDVPLSNLILNSPVGRALFPFAYGNRAMVATYDPDTYIDRIDDELSIDRPTLLAVHFTLPHWPYTWAFSGPAEGPTKSARTRSRYESTVRRADQQFRDLMSLLEERGVLRNAIVVVLSDHGESLGEQDRVTLDGESGTELFGHGTSVFSADQYRVLLAMRAYGDASLNRELPVAIDIPVSLEDIAPTFVDLLGLPPVQDFDGWSLASALKGEPFDVDAWQERIRFIETEYNPPGFAVGDIPGESELEQAAQTYRVDPVTDRLSVRPGMLDEIMAGRQFAAIKQGAILGAVPVASNEKQHLIFADSDGSISWLPAAPDPSEKALRQSLWLALSERFDMVKQRSIVAPPVPD